VTITPLVQGGKMRALAVTSAERHPLRPDTPSFGELKPGFSVGTFLGIAAPAKTPRPIVERLNREIAKAVNDETVKARLRQMGNTPKAGTPEELTATVTQYVERWTAVINRLGIAR